MDNDEKHALWDKIDRIRAYLRAIGIAVVGVISAGVGYLAYWESVADYGHGVAKLIGFGAFLFTLLILGKDFHR